MPTHFDPQRQGNLYSVQRPWSEVGLDERLPSLRKVEAMVRAVDPAIDKATARLAREGARHLRRHPGQR